MPENSGMKQNLLDSEEGQSNIKKIKELIHIADSIECSLTQLSIAWCLHNSNVSTVILGASNTKQLQENLIAVNCVEKISGAVIKDIELILNNKPESEREF